VGGSCEVGCLARYNARARLDGRNGYQ
jgi:hypothetical protein